jgi:low affinity Fe/Cu permease
LENSSARKLISRLLHRVGDLSSRAATAGLVAAGVVAFVVVLAIGGFRSEWESSFAFAASAITLVMVFVIQHTQSRQQVATQLKLDELIRSAPKADDLLIHIESADDAELIALHQGAIDEHLAIRDDASDGTVPRPVEPNAT